MVQELTPQQFLEWRARGFAMTLLDVREDWEIGVAPVPGEHMHMPMGDIPERLGELDHAKDVVVICRSGGRSAQVAAYLKSQGFTSVWNLAGGILAWSRDVDARIPQY